MVTLSTTTWEKNISKRPTIPAILISKLKMVLVEATFGAAENYATGGVDADLKQGGIKTVLAAIPAFSDLATDVEYDRENEKIMVYNANAATELAGGSQTIRGKKVEFLVLGI